MWFNRQLVRDKLEQLEMKQKDLAERIGVKPSAISQWMTGTRPITATYLRRIAKELNISYNSLTAKDDYYKRLNAYGRELSDAATRKEFAEQGLHDILISLGFQPKASHDDDFLTFVDMTSDEWGIDMDGLQFQEIQLSKEQYHQLAEEMRLYVRLRLETTIAFQKNPKYSFINDESNAKMYQIFEHFKGRGFKNKKEEV